jgi:hypothetical protein
MNGQLRQRAEGDRLQQEIQWLREEIRIKDARMEQIEADKPSHYPPQEWGRRGARWLTRPRLS